MSQAPAASRSRPTLPVDEARHLLIVDDDRRIRELLKRYLGDNGYRVSTAASAGEARDRLRGLDFDLIVLDVMMPGEDGLELTMALRETSEVPILLLTARSEPEDRIDGLERGADDYLPKPFEPRELLLRIGNILKARRSTAEHPLDVTFGPYLFRTRFGELTRNGDRVRLTERETEMLRMLATRPNETITRVELGESDEVGTRAVDVQVNRLRRKIEPDPQEPRFLLTVRGKGYVLRTD